MPRDNRYLLIHDLLLRFSRKRRLIALAFGVPADKARATLGLSEEVVLISLESNPGLTIKELSEIIHLERSWTSRIVSGLEKEGYVKSSTPPEDKRSKKLTITTKGKRTISAAGEISRLIMEQTLGNLSKIEIDSFLQFLKNFSKGLSAPPLIERAEYHPVSLELMRVSRATGITSEKYMGTDLNGTQVHILYLLSEPKPTEKMASDLGERLPFDLSTISRTLAGFVKSGIIQKKPSPKDKRKQIIVLTDKGRGELVAYRRAAQDTMESGLKDFSESDLKEAIRVLEKCTRDMPARIALSDSEEGLSLKAYSDDFLSTASAPLKKKLKSIDCKKDSYAIFIGNEFRGLVSVQKSEGSKTLDEVTFVGEDLSEKDCLAALKSVVRSV